VTSASFLTIIKIPYMIHNEINLAKNKVLPTEAKKYLTIFVFFFKS
jgi:hypothetical protein